jgi:hypothetical protein
MRREAIPSLRNGFRPPREVVDLIRRRTIGFLSHGTHLPIEHVLAEAYLQGMRDTLDALENREAA